MDRQKNGIEHQTIDYYSNGRCKWMACRKALGSNHKEEVEQCIGLENLVVMDAGINGRYYVC